MRKTVELSLRTAARVAAVAGLGFWAVSAQAEEAPGTSAPAAATDADTNSSGDIIVTAQRREEKLRDVPISVTYLGGEALQKQGVVGVYDLVKVVPGLELPVYGNYVQFAIRGISSQGAGLGDSSNVALYVDGVYQASQQSQTVDFPDVENIQVLKGPQGTLYGQNAVGGAVIITTVAPSFTLKGKLSASYGNYNDKHVYGYVTGPVSDTLAVLLSGSWQDRTGFRKDLLRGGHNPGLRQKMIKGKILYQPDDDISLTLTGFYREHNDSNSIAGFPLDNNTVAYGLADSYGLNIPRAGKKSYAMDFQPDAHLKNWGVSLNGKFETGIGTINELFAYYETRYHSYQDPDFTSLLYGQVDLPVNGTVLIEEMNFVSRPIGPVTISAGASYMLRTEHYAPQLYRQLYLGGVPQVYPQMPIPFLFLIGGHSDMRKKSYAGYLEADWKVTDHLTLTVGGRYTTEDQWYATEKLYPPIPYGPLVNSPANFHKFTPHAIARYTFNDGTNIYFSWTNGFKNGFLDATDPYAVPVNPEKVEAFEIGYKGEPISGVTLNLAGFHYNYRDLQVFIYDPTGGTHYENAASAKIYGIDADTTLKMSPDLTFTVGASWLIHAKYSNYPQAADLAPIFVPAIFNPQFGDTFGNANIAVNATGLRMIRAPKLQISATVNYVAHFAAGDLDAMLSGHYNSGYKYDVLGNVRQQRYGTLDGEIGFSPHAVQGLRIAIWGRNLTNTYYISSELNSTIGNTAAWSAPLTWGGKVEFQF